jgi:hypothetical protein
MNLMNRSGRGLKLFSLCVLALGLAAFSAAAAQAEGTWMVRGLNLLFGTKELSGKTVLSAGTLLFAIPEESLKVSITCKALELLNTKLESEGAISESSKNAKAVFSGCTTLINGKEKPDCVPVDGATKGVFLSEEGYGLLTLYKLENETKDGVVVFAPKVGTTLALIQMNGSCLIGEDLKLLGQLAMKDPKSNVGLEKETGAHTFEEFAPLTNLTVDIPELGSESKAVLDGKVEVELATGEPWNGLP